MSKRTMAMLFLVTFIQVIGMTIIIPILPALFFQGNLLPTETSVEMRSIFLGLLLACFPIAQFFAAPVLGAWSDRFGRKPILVLSLIGTFIGYLIFILGLLVSNIYLLFIGRLLDGITGGNSSIVSSVVADISNEKTKVKNFGLIGGVFGAGLIMGSLIGGALADSSILPFFNTTTPFIFAAIIVFIDIFLVWFIMPETLKQKAITKANIFSGIVKIAKAFKLRHMRAVFGTVFFTVFGFAFFTQFVQVFLYRKFLFSTTQIGVMLAFLGITTIVSQIIFVRLFVKRFSSFNTLSVTIPLTAVFLVFATLVNNVFWLYMVLFLMITFYGFNNPHLSSMVSNSTKKDEQGEMLGIQQSLAAAGQAIPPVLGGFALVFSIDAPLFLAGLSMIIAWLIFIKYK